MTVTESDRPRVDDVGPLPVVAEVDGIPVTGLLAEVAAPRAVLVALHGSGASTGYFDCPGRPRSSLLRTAQRLGYTALALDRPGYGESRPFADRLTTPRQRIDAMYGAIDAHLANRPRGAGVFLLAHSAGCELALRMAGDDRGAGLLGLEVAGTGRRHHPDAEGVLWGDVPKDDRPAGSRPPGLARLLWSPERLYPPELGGGAAIAAPAPRNEAAVVGEWVRRDLTDVVARVRIPVRYTVGEYEAVWRNDPEEQAAYGALFTASPRVVLNAPPNTGHNVSLGHTAAAYHLGVLSFVEECVVAATG